MQLACTLHLAPRSQAAALRSRSSGAPTDNLDNQREGSHLIHADRSLSFYEQNDVPSPLPNEVLSKEEEDTSNIFNRHSSLHGSSNDAVEEAYHLRPIQLTDEMLDESFEATHFWKREEEYDERRSVPRELSIDPNDPDWEFLGVLREPTADESWKERAKDKKMQTYYESLDDEDQEVLDMVLAERDRAKYSERGVRRHGRNKDDDRDELGVAMLHDGSIWALRVSLADGREEIHGWPEYTGNMSSTTHVTTNETSWLRGNAGERKGGRKLDRGVGLRLISEVNGYDMTDFPWKAQGCISSTPYSTGCACSGTKISARLVLTAAHCFIDEDTNGWDTNKYWLPGADGLSWKIDQKDPTPNGYRSSMSRFVPSAYFNHKEPWHDYGIFLLYPSCSNYNLGWFGFKASRRLLNKGVNLYGYPGKFCEDSPLSNEDCGHSIYGDFDHVARARRDWFRYNIDTQGGMSGSGVYTRSYYDGRRVIGVHVKGGSDGKEYGKAVRINSRVKDTILEYRSRYPDSSACD